MLAKMEPDPRYQKTYATRERADKAANEIASKVMGLDKDKMLPRYLVAGMEVNGAVKWAPIFVLTGETAVYIQYFARAGFYSIG